jgi:hypothetical protein
MPFLYPHLYTEVTQISKRRNDSSLPSFNSWQFSQCLQISYVMWSPSQFYMHIGQLSPLPFYWTKGSSPSYQLERVQADSQHGSPTNRFSTKDGQGEGQPDHTVTGTCIKANKLERSGSILGIWDWSQNWQANRTIIGTTFAQALTAPPWV